MADDLPYNFHEILDKNGPLITNWVTATGKGALAHLHRALEQLREVQRTHWSKPHPASSLGDHIYVIRFKHLRSQFRVFGHFQNDHIAFVMTLHGYEKGDAYFPRDYEKRARKHKLACDAGFASGTVAFPKFCAICKIPDSAPSSRETTRFVEFAELVVKSQRTLEGPRV